MGNGMNKIVPGIYVGNIRDAKDITQLEKHEITHVLAIHDQAKKLHPELQYLCIAASDCASQDLIQYFTQCNDFIHKARLQDGNVLIHCLAGVSRSVTVTAAYLMTVTDLDWKKTLNAIQGARRCANPNYGFQKQLQNFYHDGLAQEKKRMSETYAPVKHNDKEILEKLLEFHRTWVYNGDSAPEFDGINYNMPVGSLYPLPHKAYSNREASTSSATPSTSSSDTLSQRLNDIKVSSTEKGVSTATVNINQNPSYEHIPTRNIFTASEVYDPDDFIKFIDEDSDNDNSTKSSKDSSPEPNNSPKSAFTSKDAEKLSNATDEQIDQIFENN